MVVFKTNFFNMEKPNSIIPKETCSQQALKGNHPKVAIIVPKVVNRTELFLNMYVVIGQVIIIDTYLLISYYTDTEKYYKSVTVYCADCSRDECNIA